jgi:hypothetical protein
MFKRLTHSLGFAPTAPALSKLAMAYRDVGLKTGVPVPAYAVPVPVYASPAVVSDWYWDGHRYRCRRDWYTRGHYGYR